MQVELTTTSPISFTTIKEGIKLRIKHVPKKTNEYREKIGPATDCYLVFKGETKIGMIPSDFVKRNPDLISKRICTVIKLDKSEKVIAIEII